MNSMQESQNELSQEIQGLKFQDKNSDELYSNILAKIDELSSEIKTLREMKK